MTTKATNVWTGNNLVIRSGMYICVSLYRKGVFPPSTPVMGILVLPYQQFLDALWGGEYS
jgi:hypothetical protein